jgi:hypothetical protein
MPTTNHITFRNPVEYNEEQTPPRHPDDAICKQIYRVSSLRTSMYMVDKLQWTGIILSTVVLCLSFHFLSGQVIFGYLHRWLVVTFCFTLLAKRTQMSMITRTFIKSSCDNSSLNLRLPRNGAQKLRLLTWRIYKTKNASLSCVRSENNEIPRSFYRVNIV